MKTIKDMDITGKRVFFRVDFNVPLDEFQNITDDTRLRGVMPTLTYALDHGAKLIIASHLGRPSGKRVPSMSMAPVAKRLGRLLGINVKLAPDCIGEQVQKMVAEMQNGDVLLLENLRFHPQEQANEAEFAKNLAALCDIYINDAFAVSHRTNASVVAITDFAYQKAAGFLLQKELDYFKRAMAEPRRPLAAIIGGAKISSKIGAIQNMLGRVNKLIIGGAMANTFLLSYGYDLGQSKVEPDQVEVAKDIMAQAAARGVRLYLPVDAVAADNFDEGAQFKKVPIQEIPPDWMIMDIGPATSLLYAEALYDAKTIVWNGPMGVFEMDAFSRGTLAMVQSVANSYALTIVGGGDTDVAIHKAGEADRISYISTGGGAFLKLLEGKPLPAVAALNNADAG
jgi:phosphoglycerate kinase